MPERVAPRTVAIRTARQAVIVAAWNASPLRREYTVASVYRTRSIAGFIVRTVIIPGITIIAIGS